MSIDYKIDQWFVRVEPEQSFRRFTSEERNEREKKVCVQIIEDIKRHVDSFDSAILDNDGHYECSFCHSYVADKNDYECCEESIAEHEKMVAKAKETTEPNLQNSI